MVVASALVGSVSIYAKPARPKSQSTRCTSTSREGTRDAGLMTHTHSADQDTLRLISVSLRVNGKPAGFIGRRAACLTQTYVLPPIGCPANPAMSRPTD